MRLKMILVLVGVDERQFTHVTGLDEKLMRKGGISLTRGQRSGDSPLLSHVSTSLKTPKVTYVVICCWRGALRSTASACI